MTYTTQDLAATTYKEDVELDRFNLEAEAEKQASLFVKWSDELSTAKLERDRIVNSLEFKKADLDASYRSNPALFGDKKPTEAQIKAKIETSEDIVELNEELAQAKYKISSLDGAVRGLEQKKSMIDNLRHLMVAGFFSQTGTGGADNTKGIASNIRDGINNR